MDNMMVHKSEEPTASAILDSNLGWALDEKDTLNIYFKNSTFVFFNGDTTIDINKWAVRKTNQIQK